MTVEEYESAPDGGEQSGPITWLLTPFVATWDGFHWFFGTKVPDLVRAVRDKLTPIVVATRNVLSRIGTRINQLFAPILRAPLWVVDKITAGYERIAAALRPSVDKAYEAPIALGRRWQRLRARLVTRLRTFAAWLSNLALWRSAKAMMVRMRANTRAVIARTTAPARRQIAAIRKRLGRG